MKKVKIISKPSLMDKFFIRKKREAERLAAAKRPVKSRKVNLLAVQQRIAAILKEVKNALQASK